MSVNNISFEKLEKLLEKNQITTDDRFLVDSFVCHPLVDYCKDIKPNEVERIRVLEEKNIFRYLNAACIILGIYGKETLERVITTPPFSDVLYELRKEYSGKELEKNLIVLMIKMLLALGENQITTPIFEGEMPQRFMSFRNQTAKEWFKDFVTTKVFILANIYEKASLEEAKAHLFSSIAYQLHHSNRAKYNIDPIISMNNTLTKILKKFIDEQNGDSSILYNDSGEILSKVL